MQSSLPIRPFAFDRTFTAPEPSRPPTHRRKTDAKDLALEVELLRRELATVRDLHRCELATTRAEAFEAGLDHARTEREAAVLAAIDALQASMEAVGEQYEDLRAELVADASNLALAAAEALAGRAIELDPGRTVDEAIGRALAQLARGQEIDVKVHPDLVEDIERRVAERQSGDRRRLHVSISGDPAIPEGDALFAWDKGGVELNAADRRRLVMEEVASLVQGTTP